MVGFNFIEKKQYKDFQLYEDSFSYKDKVYDFANIKTIYFEWMNINQYMNFTKIQEAQKIDLKLYMLDGEKIRIAFDERGFWYGSKEKKKEDIDNLKEVYSFIAKKTFQNRHSNYLRQIEKNGFFEYGGCQFYPNNKIVFRGRDFLLNSSTFVNLGSWIEMRKKDWGLLNKVKRELTLTKLPSFETNEDTDVLFFLLDKLFGLRWK